MLDQFVFSNRYATIARTKAMARARDEPQIDEQPHAGSRRTSLRGRSDRRNAGSAGAQSEAHRLAGRPQGRRPRRSPDPRRSHLEPPPARVQVYAYRRPRHAPRQRRRRPRSHRGQDECGGLPPGKVAKLFQPFSQRGVDRTKLGLGLSSCQKAATTSGGEVRARDLPLKGSVFTLDLPSGASPPR